MKFSVSKQDMTEAVTNLQRAVSTKSSIPALEGILIKTDDGALTLSAYNLEIGMSTTIPALIGESGRIVLSARLFGDIVRRMPADTMDVSIDKNYIATIRSGMSEFTIIGMPAEEFPEFPSFENDSVIRMPSNVLKSMIGQTLFAISESDTKPIHQGSLFNIVDGTLDVVSVDGYRLAVRTEAINYDEDTYFVIPGKTLSELLKLLRDDDSNVTFYVGMRNIRIETESYTLLSSLFEGEFLDYKAAIPAAGDTNIIVNTREFINSVERVSLLITEKLKSPVRCICENDEIRISCSTAIGKASDAINAQIVGNPVEIGFNSKYLLDALRNADCDEVLVQMKGSLSPMKIMPKEGNSFLFLVLPVRIRAND